MEWTVTTSPDWELRCSKDNQEPGCARWIFFT
jgi:hypothetical protein